MSVCTNIVLCILVYCMYIYLLPYPLYLFLDPLYLFPCPLYPIPNIECHILVVYFAAFASEPNVIASFLLKFKFPSLLMENLQRDIITKQSVYRKG